MCITYSVLSYKLATSFSSFTSFQIKKTNHYEVHIIFENIEHQLEENIFHHFLHYNFL